MPTAKDPKEGVNERLEERRRREAAAKVKAAKELTASREAVRAKQGRLAAKLDAQRRAKEAAAKRTAAEADLLTSQQVRGERLRATRRASCTAVRTRVGVGCVF